MDGKVTDLNPIILADEVSSLRKEVKELQKEISKLRHTVFVESYEEAEKLKNRIIMLENIHHVELNNQREHYDKMQRGSKEYKI